MSTSFSHIIVWGFLSLSCFGSSAYAQSNSKGENSSVVVGILKEVNAAEGKFKVLRTGQCKLGKVHQAELSWAVNSVA